MNPFDVTLKFILLIIHFVLYLPIIETINKLESVGFGSNNKFQKLVLGPNDINPNVSCNVKVIDRIDYLVTCEYNSVIQIEEKIDCCAIIESETNLSYEWGTCHLRNDPLRDDIFVLSIPESTSTKCQIKMRLVSTATILKGNFSASLPLDGSNFVN